MAENLRAAGTLWHISPFVVRVWCASKQRMAHKASCGPCYVPVVVAAPTTIGTGDGHHNAPQTREASTADRLNRGGRLVAPTGSLDDRPPTPLPGARAGVRPAGVSALKSSKEVVPDSHRED
jgi:hypothetical protein